MSQSGNYMRDALIEGICRRMHGDESIFFLSADLGSPKLDRLRETFKDRFINVGIAEQNLINVAAGLAFEGYTVFAYAIASFMTMRAYEQIRVNLALHAQVRSVNVNLIGVGSGVSYDVSGPTHHCLEDISIMRTLPNVEVFSPSDSVLAARFLDRAVAVKQPKYIRFDSKPLPDLYAAVCSIGMEDCFCELRQGSDVCLVATGYMTHTALKAAEMLKNKGVSAGVIDVFGLKPFAEEPFFKAIEKYSAAITIEEAYVGKNGLDNLVTGVVRRLGSDIKLVSIGVRDTFEFELGGREYLHRLNGMDAENIVGIAAKVCGLV